MHGRAFALPGTLLMMAFMAAPASADQTLGLGQAADADGVVTSWKVTSGPAQPAVRLRAEQAVGGGGTVTTATSDPVDAAAGAAVAARLPVAAGGTLTLVGATGSPTVAATVEPDADGDGFGDTTQDACPRDFTDHAAPCGGTTTVGSPLTLAPDPRGFSGGSGSPMQARQAAAPGVPIAVAAPGILTRLRLRTAAAAGPAVVQVLRPAAGGTYTVVAESAPVDPTTQDVVSLPAQVAVQAGDVLAARSVTGDLGTVAYRAGDALATRQPPRTLGDPAFPIAGTYADRRLLVQADVEPDADGDGKGDVSQDAADLQVTGAAPGAVEATDSWAQTFTVRNAGPDAALDVSVELRGAGVATPQSPPAGVACADTSGANAAGMAVTCRVARLAAGASLALTPASISPASFPPPAGTVTTTAIATALTPDPNTTNNAVTLVTTIRPYVPNLPPQAPFVVPACAHVVRGTRDDDVLRGTAFGDRLVGNDGDDLLKGLGGDDCLEGGAGNDVIDGGDGNDRLAGSAGRDRMSGGTGNDKLTGGRGNDVLTGGPGNDTLSPGAGKDAVSAGSGNDTINTVDGVRETVDCGGGRDTVRADRRDRLKHCEKVTRKK